MAKTNNNQGNNPIWADNSDRNISAMVTPLMSTPPETPPEDSGETASRAPDSRQLLKAIAQESVRLGRAIIQKLMGSGKV